MFKLAQRGGSDGLHCGPEGLFLGPSPLIVHIGGVYRLRAEDEITDLLATAYGSPAEGQGLPPRLRLIREALQEGDHCRAMILAVQARLGPVMPDGIARLARTEALGKYSFNPDEPRDRLGRWTSAEDAASPGEAAADGHPALMPAQELLPFATPENVGNRGPTQLVQNDPLNFSTHAWARMLQKGFTPEQVNDAIKSGSRVTQPNGNIRCTGAGCVVIINPSGRIVTIY